MAEHLHSLRHPITSADGDAIPQHKVKQSMATDGMNCDQNALKRVYRMGGDDYVLFKLSSNEDKDLSQIHQ